MAAVKDVHREPDYAEPLLWGFFINIYERVLSLLSIYQRLRQQQVIKFQTKFELYRTLLQQDTIYKHLLWNTTLKTGQLQLLLPE